MNNENVSLMGLFHQFFSAQNGKGLTPEQEAYMKKILDPEKDGKEECK